MRPHVLAAWRLLWDRAVSARCLGQLCRFALFEPSFFVILVNLSTISRLDSRRRSPCDRLPGKPSSSLLSGIVGHDPLYFYSYRALVDPPARLLVQRRAPPSMISDPRPGEQRAWQQSRSRLPPPDDASTSLEQPWSHAGEHMHREAERHTPCWYRYPTA